MKAEYGFDIGMSQNRLIYYDCANNQQWKAFRFFDLSQVKLAEEESSLLSEVGGIRGLHCLLV